MKKQLSLTRRFFPLLCASGLALSCGGIDPNANDNMGGDNPPKVNPFEAKPECSGDKVDFKKGSRGLVVSNLEIAAFPNEQQIIDAAHRALYRKG